MQTVVYRPKNGEVALPPKLVLSQLRQRVSLMKGANVLSEADVEFLQEHSDGGKYFSNGVLELVKPGETAPLPEVLTNLGMDHVESLIDNCNDLEQLRTWRKTENRYGPQQLLAERISLLEAAIEAEKRK